MDELTRALKEGRAVFQAAPEGPPPGVNAARVNPVRGRAIGHRTLPGSPVHAGVFRGAHLLDPTVKPEEATP